MKYTKRLLHVLFFIVTFGQGCLLWAISCSVMRDDASNMDMLIPRIIMYGTIIEIILAIVFQEYVGKLFVWLGGGWL
jgi:hypothetical protein